jgi:hypothetical protein
VYHLCHLHRCLGPWRWGWAGGRRALWSFGGSDRQRILITWLDTSCALGADLCLCGLCLCHGRVRAQDRSFALACVREQLGVKRGEDTERTWTSTQGDTERTHSGPAVSSTQRAGWVSSPSYSGPAVCPLPHTAGRLWVLCILISNVSYIYIYIYIY